MDDGPRITMSRRPDPTVSGKWSAGWLALCLMLSAILLPVAAHLPRWVEVELVLGAWWIIWVVAIAALLYRGSTVTDDLAEPTAEPPRKSVWERIPKVRVGSQIDVGLWDAESVAGCVVAVLAILLLVAGWWLAVEVLIPGLAFLVYAVVRGMVARAVNGRAHCSERLLACVAWGLFWSTIYTVPIALTVVAVHASHPNLARLSRR